MGWRASIASAVSSERIEREWLDILACPPRLLAVQRRSLVEVSSQRRPRECRLLRRLHDFRVAVTCPEPLRTMWRLD